MKIFQERCRMDPDMGKCYFCSKEIDPALAVYRSSTCSSCGNDLKICYNCRFYSSASHHECRETISERVAEKDRANFCDYFKIGNDYVNDSLLEKQKESRKKIDDLFNS